VIPTGLPPDYTLNWLTSESSLLAREDNSSALVFTWSLFFESPAADIFTSPISEAIWAAVSDTWDMEVLTSLTPEETSAIFRAISFVAEDCSSMAEAMDVTISLVSLIVSVMLLILSMAFRVEV